MKRSEQKPAVAVVIGRVSTEDGDRILETLAALAGSDCEIVIADRLQDGISKRIAKDYPTVRLIPCDPDASLPEMRTRAFEASTAAIVAVTEDHCVPAPGWVEILKQAFEAADPEVLAVGGCVTNGVTDTGFDWATFLCEYSFFAPAVREGITDVLPGMNIGYRRQVLEEAPRELLTTGFWETTLHPRLLESGGKLLSLNRLRMNHCKKFSLRLFVTQRFLYSRYYSGLRFGGAPLPRRAAAAVACLLLPPILLARAAGAARRKQLMPEFARALPAFLLLVVVWSWGESVGALFGAGDALARIE